MKDREKDVQDLKMQLVRAKGAVNYNSSTPAVTAGPLPVGKRLSRPSSAKTPGVKSYDATEKGMMKRQMEMKEERIKALEDELLQSKSGSNNNNGKGSATVLVQKEVKGVTQPVQENQSENS